jgi:class 3 adenylate cyclase/tetratricopeptide (TPR) repeat protein
LADKILTSRATIEGECKVVTVLFADVANYTSMAEQLDPEEVHQIMDGCFRIMMDEIHKYEGTINQFTGDGVMALFGAPVAHEDHAHRACHVALAMQKNLKEYGDEVRRKSGIDFTMRTGINSGPVVVGAIGDDLRMDYTAIGDTTNLASRMEKFAKPGTIIITHHTHKLVKDFFEFTPMGRVEVKGKEEPQEVYELTKVSDVETRIEAAAVRGLTKFTGRKKELEALKEAFDRARSGSGQVVGIVGEAGVGKSRILLELRKTLSGDEAIHLEARCLPYGRSMTYLPILDLIKSYFDIGEGDREFIKKRKVEEKTLKLDEGLSSYLPPLQEFLSLHVEDEKYLQLDPGQKKVRTFEAIRDLLIRESEKRPLVIAIEDLHWVDKTSEEFLDYLIGWIAGAHILLVLLYRPEYIHQWGSKSYYSKIGVDRFSTDTSAELLQVVLKGGDVAPELRELILGRSGGNPLFVEELTSSLLENGFIQRKIHRYVLTRTLSEIQVPDTIQGIIAARMDRLQDDLKRTIQVASVIGRGFPFRILQTTMGMSEELKSHLLSLQALEFISEKKLFPELEYIFKHALTQEVAYNSLLQKKRKEIHERIGRAIEELYPDRLEEYYELLAYHYGRSDKKEKALGYLDLANRKAAQVNAMQEAKAYFDEAMKSLDTLPDTEDNRQWRISLLVRQWSVFQLLFKFPEYYGLLTQCESIAAQFRNQALLGAIYVRKGHCEWWFGSLDQAIETVTKAVELCEASGSAEDAGYAYTLLEWCHLYKGDYEQVLTSMKEVIHRFEQQFNRRWCVLALSGASWAYAQTGRWDEALQKAREALKVAEEYANDSLVSYAALFISYLHTWKRDLTRAAEYGDLAVQKASTPADKAWAQVALAHACCRADDPARGVELLSGLIPMYRTSQWALGESYATIFLGEGYWLTGEFGKARETLEKGLELAETCGMRYWVGSAHRLLGEVFLETHPNEASEHFEKSMTVLQEIGAENELAAAYAGYGRLHKQQGDVARAREYLSKALEIFERLGTLVEPDKLREELAELPEE